MVGNKFVVKTDHNSLRHVLTQKYLNERKKKWVNNIQAYDFDIEYVKGKNNIVADALSRRPSFSLMDIAKNWKDMLLVEYANDKFACDVLDGLMGDDNYIIFNGLIYYKVRIYLVRYSKLKYNFFQEAHDSPLAGHPRIFKTYRQLRKRFYWKAMKEYVQNYVNEFNVCQKNKSELTYPARLLQPLPILEQKWDNISMDFITGLPKYLGKDCIYVVVDILNKFSHLFDVTSYFSDAQVAYLFFR